MRITTCRPIELGEFEVQRWRELQSATHAFRHPFLSVEFARAVSTVSERTRVAVVDDGARIVGFFPYDHAALAAAQPLAGVLTYRQAFIHEPGYEWTWRELLRAAGLHSVELSDVVAAQAAREPRLELLPSPIIDATESWDTYLKGANRHKHIKTVRYKARKLERELGDVEFAWSTTDMGALDQLIGWKSRQYRRSGWRDPFARRGVRALLDLLTASDTGELRPVMTTLHARGHLLAADLSLNFDTFIAGWFSAYDPEFRAYSPGAIRIYRSIEHACGAADASCIDMARGDESFKNALKTGDVLVGNGSVHQPSARAFAYRAARAPGTAAKRYILEHEQVRATVRRSLRALGSARDSLP